MKLLFLGDQGHHKPMERFRQLEPVLAKRGIELTYTGQVTSLDPKILASYDGLVIFANHTKMTAEQEKALLDYVASGKGFIPLHCASYCFIDSKPYIDLVGAQFLRHGTGTFRTTIAEKDHPIMKGYSGFESWDETYVHTKHNEKDRIVLEYREEGNQKEPWTWVRTHGKGRVFYTAWGHDERTWGNAGFHNLVERGIRWACGQDPTSVGSFRDRPEMTTISKDVKPFEYIDAKIPFYPPGPRGKGHDPIAKMQKPLSAAESMKHIIHPVGFELKLFIDERKLGAKPICMNWDERGRLWVALTYDYPNELQPEGKGRDKIVICEDSDNDGAADKVTTFAEKLSIPTSITFANGGVIVHQAPHTLFLKDTNGDDVADERKILFSGWHTNDTHAGPSNLHYGPDNWIYGIVGYSGFDGMIGGQRQSFRTGFYRFKADGSQFEFLRNTNNNSWGVGFSEEGILFGSTANGNPSVYLPIPNRYYESVRGWSSKVLGGIAGNAPMYPITDKVRQVDWHGHHTAAAGHALYTARAYPREYWNRTAFVAEPTGHVVSTFTIQNRGSDFSSRNAWNLIASDDEWVSPIMAEVGPDGQVWIIDWYNFIVQHNPTPQGFKTGKGNAYETELRDRKHGRIYRLVYKDAPAAKPMNLKGATPEQLVAALTNDNMFWRKHAQRLLVERGQKDVVPALLKLVSDPKVDEVGLNVGAMHALWTLQGLGVFQVAQEDAMTASVAALKHASPGVRRAALMVLPRNEAGLKALLDARLVEDQDAQVRLAAFLALAEMPADAKAASVIAESLTQSMNISDAWIPDAMTSAAARHDLPFLQAVMSKPTAYEPRALEIIGIVAEHYARGGAGDTAGDVLKNLGSASPAVSELVLARLAKGWPKGRAVKLSPEQEKQFAGLLTRLSPAGKSQLLRLAGTWNVNGLEMYLQEVYQALLNTVKDEKLAEEARVNAARDLIDLATDNSAHLSVVLDAIHPRTSPYLASGLLEAAGRSEAATLAEQLLKRLPNWSPAIRGSAIRILIGKATTARAFVEALQTGKISINDLTLEHKQLLLNHPTTQVAKLAKGILQKGGGLPNPDRQKVIDDLMSVTKKTGIVAAGKEMFKKHCSACHQINGEGNKVGPDLTGMSVHPKSELIVHILDPNRSVEGNYRLYKVTTSAGKTLQGMLTSETKTSIELVDTEAKKQVVLREDIEQLTATNQSLMPEGFEKQMNAEELTNLLEFLTQKGKYVPLPLDKVATIVSTKGMFFKEESTVERLVLADWKPKVFEGIPFVLVDPLGDKVPNVVLMYGPYGLQAPKMPRSVTLPCNSSAKAIHFLSGISGWGYPATSKGSVSLIVRLHYEDGKTEDHPLRNGEHFADYIRKVEVPSSKFAYACEGRQQIRYLSVKPERSDVISRIELLKGRDDSAPIVVAVTIETK